MTRQEAGVLYRSRAYRRLRRGVLEMDKYECQDCKAKGKYTKATEVHHVLTVDKYPEYAMSLYQPNGGRQLVSLCSDCHKFGRHGYQHEPKVANELTEERW